MKMLNELKNKTLSTYGKGNHKPGDTLVTTTDTKVGTVQCSAIPISGFLNFRIVFKLNGKVISAKNLENELQK